MLSRRAQRDQPAAAKPDSSIVSRTDQSMATGVLRRALAKKVQDKCKCEIYPFDELSS